MITRKAFVLIALIGAGSATEAHAQARAGHSEYLAGLTRQALEQPFRSRTLPVLEVVEGPGREQTARALLALVANDAPRPRRSATALALAPVTLARQADDDKVLTYAGDRGYFDVIADGSAFRYRADIDASGRPRSDAAQRIDPRELEKLGRRFLAGPLGKLVVPGRGETVTFLGVRRLYEGDGTTEVEASRAESARVVANIAVFGRSINGVPVVGSGSKVAVWFDNARKPVGFDVDWPKYRAARARQDLLPTRELHRRVTATAVAPRGEAAIAVDRFECGFVDLGATRRDRNVQAGCSITYHGTSGEEPWARIDFVPAAVDVRRERRWPLANALAAGHEVKIGSAEYERYVDPVEAPKDAPGERPGS